MSFAKVTIRPGFSPATITGTGTVFNQKITVKSGDVEVTFDGPPKAIQNLINMVIDQHEYLLEDIGKEPSK